MKHRLLSLGLFGLIASGHAGFAEASHGKATTLDGIYAEAAADCAAHDNGSFSPGEAAVAEVDLTGDGKPEQIVNTMGFMCSTLASLYGGSGGAPIVVLADGKRFEWEVLGYQVVTTEFLPPVLLMSVHGTRCHGTGSDACAEAVVWNGESFLSVADPAK